MTFLPDISEFLNTLQASSKRKFTYPSEVRELLQIVLQTGLTNEFDELIFQAKFLVRTQTILNRIGKEKEGYEKLAAEFQSGITKAQDLLKRLVERATADVSQRHSDLFFAMETESMSRLMVLFSDLSLIKNWQIDGNPMPYQTGPVKRTTLSPGIKDFSDDRLSEKSYSPVLRSAILATILMVVVLSVDPPVTILGWILSLGIAALLVYITIQIRTMTKRPNTH